MLFGQAMQSGCKSVAASALENTRPLVDAKGHVGPSFTLPFCRIIGGPNGYLPGKRAHDLVEDSHGLRSVALTTSKKDRCCAVQSVGVDGRLEVD